MANAITIARSWIPGHTVRSERAGTPECLRTFVTLLEIRCRVTKAKLPPGCICYVLRAGCFFNQTDVLLLRDDLPLRLLGPVLEMALIVLASSRVPAIAIPSIIFDPAGRREELAKDETEFADEIRMAIALEQANRTCSLRVRLAQAIQTNLAAMRILRGEDPKKWNGSQRYDAMRQMLAVMDGDPDIALRRLNLVAKQEQEETMNLVTLLSNTFSNASHLRVALNFAIDLFGFRPDR